MPNTATHKPVLHDSGAAAADYSSSQFYGVYLSAVETLTLNATAGGWNCGPLQDNPASGEFGTTMLLGLSQAEAGGTWAVGDPLAVTSAGKYIKSLDNTDYISCRALEVVASGENGTVFMSQEGYNSSFGDFAADGRGDLHLARCTFDPSANAGERTIAAHTVVTHLPDNAIVMRGYYLVITTFTTAGSDAGTLSIGIPTDDAAGIVAATAVSAGGDIWDAGWHDTIQGGTITDASTPCTAERLITFTIAGQAFTAGKLILFLEYVITD